LSHRQWPRWAPGEETPGSSCVVNWRCRGMTGLTVQ
jgi:hypothetical protein